MGKCVGVEQLSNTYVEQTLWMLFWVCKAASAQAISPDPRKVGKSQLKTLAELPPGQVCIQALLTPTLIRNEISKAYPVPAKSAHLASTLTIWQFAQYCAGSPCSSRIV